MSLGISVYQGAAKVQSQPVLGSRLTASIGRKDKGLKRTGSLAEEGSLTPQLDVSLEFLAHLRVISQSDNMVVASGQTARTKSGPCKKKKKKKVGKAGPMLPVNP